MNGGYFMKKHFAVILTLAVMFSFAGCGTHQSDSQESSSAISETSSTISETKAISKHLIEEEGHQYLILPISQSKIFVGDEYKQYLDDIDIELLKTAEQTICDKMSAYTETPGFSLQFDNSGKLCLYTEWIVDIDPPNIVTDYNGKVIEGGCNIDHKHIFFYERITK